MINQEHIISKSLLAGIAIGIGGYIYLSTSNPIIGSILFSVGLLSCVFFELPLFTGKSGFVHDNMDFRRLMLVLILNVVGASLLGFIVGLINEPIQMAADNIVYSRINTSYLVIAFNSIITGFLMTLAIESEYSDRPNCHIPLILAVCTFIISGCFHSIADSFYYAISAIDSVTLDHFGEVYSRLILEIMFNFVGCNVYNIMVNKSIIHE